MPVPIRSISRGVPQIKEFTVSFTAVILSVISEIFKAKYIPPVL